MKKKVTSSLQSN